MAATSAGFPTATPGSRLVSTIIPLILMQHRAGELRLDLVKLSQLFEATKLPRNGGGNFATRNFREGDLSARGSTRDR